MKIDENSYFREKNAIVEMKIDEESAFSHSYK